MALEPSRLLSVLTCRRTAPLSAGRWPDKKSAGEWSAGSGYCDATASAGEAWLTRAEQDDRRRAEYRDRRTDRANDACDDRLGRRRLAMSDCRNRAIDDDSPQRGSARQFVLPTVESRKETDDDERMSASVHQRDASRACDSVRIT